MHRTLFLADRYAGSRLVMHQIMQGLTQQFFASPAEQPLGLGIHEGAATVGIGSHHPLTKGIGQAVEETVALLNLVFLLLQAQ